MGRLTWRDGIATLLVAAATLAALAALNGWGWLLLGDARAGAIAVLAIGFAASVLGGGPQWFMAALTPGSISGEGRLFSLVAGALGLATFGLLAATIWINSLPLLTWATVALVGLWLIASIHHSLEPRPPLGRRQPA